MHILPLVDQSKSVMYLATSRVARALTRVTPSIKGYAQRGVGRQARSGREGEGDARERSIYFSPVYFEGMLRWLGARRGASARARATRWIFVWARMRGFSGGLSVFLVGWAPGAERARGGGRRAGLAHGPA